MAYNILFVALGGALGSVARYLVSEWTREASDTVFPLGTLLVNVIGCLLIGLFNGIAERCGMGGMAKTFLTVGFCGGFTTFSTFMNENLALMRGGNFLVAVGYAVLSLVLGLAAVYFGRFIAVAGN